MTFHITYKLTNGQRNEAQDRFRSTGALPPNGVTMKGRWHSVNGNSGFMIAESTDLEAIGTWIHQWSDLLTFDVTPVLTDEQIGKIIG